MVLFILRKLILQTRMRSHPVGLNVWFFVGPFVYFHPSCVRTAKALARLRGCAGSPEPLLVAYVISTTISWAASIMCIFQPLKGGRDFTFRSGCTEFLCECFCNGTYVCPPERSTNFCEDKEGRGESGERRGRGRLYYTAVSDYL